MAATAITPIGLSFNTVNATKRKMVTATPSTAGSTFAIASSLLGDYSKVALVILTSGSSDNAKLTVYASTLFTNGDNYVANINSTHPVGSTSAYVFAGPFESARFKSTNGLKFKIASQTAGDTAKVTIFALGLPGYK
jgi:hypothetical protein